MERLKNNKVIKNRKFIIGLILLAIIIGALLRFVVLPQKAATESTIVKRGNITQELTLSGKIDADEHATLQFQTGGQLAWVGVKEGDYVQKYQTVASLDQRQLKKTLEKKLNDYMNQRWDFEQTKDDYKDSITTDRIKRILEKSQFDLNNSVLDVELQSLSVELANLWTPIEGIVTRVDMPYTGVNIYLPSQAQFEITNLKTLFFDVTADQTEVVDLKEGNTATVVLDSYSNSQLKGVIKNISFSPKKDETGTVYQAKVTFGETNNKNYNFRLGMTGDATFVTAKRNNVLYLPLNFVKSDDKGKYVLLGNEKKKTYIKTGLETETDTEITQGLKAGDIVYD